VSVIVLRSENRFASPVWLLKLLTRLTKAGFACMLVLVGAGCAPGKVYGGYVQQVHSVGWTGTDKVAFVYSTASWIRLYEHDISSGKTSLLIDGFPAYTFDSNKKGILYWSKGKTYEFNFSDRSIKEIPGALSNSWIIYDSSGLISILRPSVSNGGHLDDGGVYKIDEQGQSSKIGRLPNLKNATAFSPNRELVATVNSAGTVIYRLDTSGSAVATTTGLPIGWQDNDNLIIVKSDPGADPYAPGKLYRYHIPSGRIDFIAARPAIHAAPSLDGKLVAFHDLKNVFTIPANGSDVTVRVDVMKDLPPGERVLIP
jgi:hypothetical protein